MVDPVEPKTTCGSYTETSLRIWRLILTQTQQQTKEVYVIFEDTLVCTAWRLVEISDEFKVI